MSNIFFPEKLSPQGYLTDMLLAQMRSGQKPFPDFKKLIYGFDYGKRTGNRLFCFHPAEKDILIKESLKNTPKNSSTSDGYFSKAKDQYVMRRYINFLNSMTPAQQAALVPYIRLYVKVMKGKGDNKKFIKTKEIVFNKDYRIPNAPNALFDSGQGTGNAGIEDLSVVRKFQYFGERQDYTVTMSFLFDSYETFANGMQRNNLFGNAIDAISLGASAFNVQDEPGYINLIKKIAKRTTDGDDLYEYLMLEYGYKFPDDIDQELVSNEDRIIFESQEKKELVINAHKHDFRFSETGEVSLTVTYLAHPETQLRARNEKKTNDVFIINNSKVIKEMMDEPSESGIRKSEIQTKLRAQLLLLKQLNLIKKNLTSDYCPDDVRRRSIKEVDEKISETNKKIKEIKRALVGYMEHFFLRYFMSTKSLFHISFKPDSLEVESSVLSPTNYRTHNSIEAVKAQNLKVFLDRVTPQKTETDEQGNVVNIQSNVRTNYKDKIKELYEKKYFFPQVTDSTARRGSALTSEQIRKRFSGGVDDILPSDQQGKNLQLSYAFYEALQTFTLSRLAAQAALVRSGNKQTDGEFGAEETTTQVINGTDTSFHTERYGNICFFPLKALVAAVIDFSLDDEGEEEEFPVICLGNAIADSMGKEFHVNLGDLLVDKDFFKEWLQKNFIDTEKFDPTLDDFLKAIFEGLVPSILRAGVGHFNKGNHGGIKSQTFEVSRDIFNNPEILKDLESDEESKRAKARAKLASSIKKPAKLKEVKRPLVIYYQDGFNNPTSPKQLKASILRKFQNRNYNKKKDYSEGIYHVYAGQNTGIVKRIDFSYIQDPNLNTALAIRNPNNLAPYLRYSYEARIDFFGNDLFFGNSNFFAIPQNQFNVKQTGITIDRPERDVFGLSGYYQISETRDRISMGNYTTSVIAKNMWSPALQKAKLAKCPNRPSITSPSSGGPGGVGQGEKEIPLFVKHDIAEYIDKAFVGVARLRERFNVRLDNEEYKKFQEESSSE